MSTTMAPFRVFGVGPCIGPVQTPSGSGTSSAAPAGPERCEDDDGGNDGGALGDDRGGETHDGGGLCQLLSAVVAKLCSQWPPSVSDTTTFMGPAPAGTNEKLNTGSVAIEMSPSIVTTSASP